jgi:uncharacterized integral membrane protein
MSSPSRPRGDTAEAGTSWKRWALVVAAILVLIVVLQNSQEVEFNLLFVNTTAPLILLLLVFTMLGAAIGYLFPIVRRGRKDHRD